jgi:DNA-binding IclR family transcriptional regulator
MTVIKKKQEAGIAFRRTFKVLTFLIEHGEPIGAQELADRLELNIATAQRLLGTLVSEGLAICDPATKYYSLGPAFTRLAAMAVQSASLEQIIQPILRNLVEATGETACLNIYHPNRDRFSVVAVEESDHPLRYVVEIGKFHNLFAGASGKTILAFLPAKKRNKIITDDKPLKTQLEDIRNQGYKISFGERIPGAVGIAAPVFNQQEKVIGSIQITIPEHRFDTNLETILAKDVMTAARQLSDMLAQIGNAAILKLEESGK